ncbi:MAG: hypothetical protein IKU19_04450 [Clostridia bacterium]|nr:hypothetical protein [Clostridia bacterium]
MNLKRVLSLLITMVMLMGIIPVASFAQEFTEPYLVIRDVLTDSFVTSVTMYSLDNRNFEVYLCEGEGQYRSLSAEAVTWSTTNEEVVKVSKGRVTAFNDGFAYIDISYMDENGNGYITSLTVCVGDPIVDVKLYDAAWEDVTNTTIEIFVGDTITLNAEAFVMYGMDSYVDYEGFEWYTFGYGLNVDNGVITANDTGTYMISCAYTDIEGIEFAACVYINVKSSDNIPIYTVEILGVDYPVVGREVDFEAELPEGANFHFAVPSDGYSFYNNMRWYDATEKRDLLPGDKFEADHLYDFYIGIAPNEGYEFAVNEDGNSIVSVTCGDIELRTYAFAFVDKTQYLAPRTDYYHPLSPLSAYKLNLDGGVAYNEKGVCITTAVPGEKVTVYVEDPLGLDRNFNRWELKGVEVDSVYNYTLTFTMPENDVNITAVFDNKAVSELSFELNGYYSGNSATNMAFFNYGEGVGVHTYTVYTDYNNAPYNQFTGVLGYGTYWLAVEMSSYEGYHLAALNLFNITMTVDGQTVYPSHGDFGAYTATVYFNLGELPCPDLYYIDVYGGSAYYNNSEVYYAPAGSMIRLYADNPEEGKTFAYWNVNTENVEICVDDAGGYYFIMPEGNVSVTAKYKGAIDTVYINDITYPAAGEAPDYEASTYEEDGYSLYALEDWATVNGVLWTKEYSDGSAEKLDPATAVFEPGCKYTVSVFLEAQDGYYFKVNEYGAYDIDAFINGSYSVTSSIGLDMSKYISISYTYEIPAIHNITVEGGNAYAPRSNNTPTGNGESVTSAQEGEYIRVIADEAPLGRVFDHWEIVSGAIKVSEDDLLYEEFSFIMPDEDVVIRAVFVYTHGDPELAVDGYDVLVSHASDLTYIRYALGEYKTAGEIKNAADCVTLNSKKIAEYTANDVCTINMADGGLYSFWLKTADGREYILYADLTTMEQYLTSYGVTLTVHNLYGVRDFFIAKGDYDTYADIKANYIVNVTSAKINGAHDYSYILSEPGFYTVYIRYTDSTRPATVLKTTLEVTEPYFVENGLQLTVGNLDDIKVIRTAYGRYSTPGDVKRAEGARAFSGKDVLKGKDEYTIQYRNNGLVTVAVVYNNGYTVMYYYDVQQKVPEMTQKGNVISFFELDDLKLIRYAEGEYVTSKEIKNAKGSKVVKPEDLNYGFFQIELDPGTYTFCVQYNDESYNYYVVNVG